MSTLAKISVVFLVSFGLAACGSGRKGSSSNSPGAQFKAAANMNAEQEKFYAKWVDIHTGWKIAGKCKYFDSTPAKKKDFQDKTFRLDGHFGDLFAKRSQSQMAFIAMGHESNVGRSAPCGDARSRKWANESYDDATQWLKQLDRKKK